MKEPSLFRQIIAVHYEQAKRRKALRVLQKQIWSLDFLSAVLVKAGRLLGDGVQLVIEDRDHRKITLSYDTAKQSAAKIIDDNIFNHLDDDMAVDRFIRENSVR